MFDTRRFVSGWNDAYEHYSTTGEHLTTESVSEYELGVSEWNRRMVPDSGALRFWFSLDRPGSLTLTYHGITAHDAGELLYGIASSDGYEYPLNRWLADGLERDIMARQDMGASHGFGSFTFT